MLLPATLLLAQFVVEKEVTLITDGQTRQLRSRAGLVGQLLREQAIALQAGDLVEPGPASLLLSGQQVRVSRARSVLLSVDGATHILRTLHSDPAAILADAGLQVAAGDALLVNGLRLDPAQAIAAPALVTHLGLQRQKTFQLREGATTRTLRSSGRTVGEALFEAGVTLYLADGLQPPPETALTEGMQRAAHARAAAHHRRGRRLAGDARPRHTRGGRARRRRPAAGRP